MHLPGPLRAAVGLVATAAAEARHLPDRAIELPMLAVSSAMQASLRAQQRYARLAARGDEVLNRRAPTEQPPPWATFDDPVPVGELRRTAGEAADADKPSMFDELFGVEDPTLPVDGREPVDEIVPADEPLVAPDVQTPVVPVSPDARGRSTADGSASARTSAPSTTTAPTTTARKSPARKTTARKTPARKTAPGKTAPGKTAAGKTAAKKTASKEPLSKPRHTAPSAFDNVADE
ncbi:hypothetical protein [uncultured Jatrophihabitans sp.]|uniref:hypothetical protein n=1 Tax=uncultured Jatrophihabitans sp. TaxID=1610747 RepID=UPI0035C98EF4